jgi:WD40 repeat protein
MMCRSILFLVAFSFTPLARVAPVQEPTPPPVVRLSDAYFPRDRTHLNEEILAILDDAALRLRMDPRMTLVVDGHSDVGERPGVGPKRALNLRGYLLAEKGLDPSRIVVRVFDDRYATDEPAENQRVALSLIGSGISPSGIAQLEASPIVEPSAAGRVVPVVNPRFVTQSRHGARIRGTTYSPDGRTIATASEDRTSALWDAATGRRIADLVGHTGPVVDVAFSANGRVIATASDDGMAALWKAKTGVRDRVLAGHSAGVTCVAFSPDSRFVATGSKDRTARLWDAATGAEVRRLGSGTSRIDDVAFSPDGSSVALGCADGRVRIVGVATSSEIRVLERHEQPILSVSFSADGTTVLTGSFDGTVRLWDARSGKEVRRSLGEQQVLSAQFSPDSRFVVTTSVETVRVLDAATCREIVRTNAVRSTVDAAAFSPDGRSIAVAGGDGVCHILDAASLEDLRRLEGETEAITAFAFSRTGRFLAVGQESGLVRLWDLDLGRERRRFSIGRRRVDTLQVSPDGRYLAAQGHEEEITYEDWAGPPTYSRLWNAVTGRLLVDELTEQFNELPDLSPAGGRGLSMSEQPSGTYEEHLPSTFLVERTGTETVLHRFKAHLAEMSVDERFVASALNGVLVIRDARTGRVVRRLAKNLGRVSRLSFAPNGRTLLAQSGAGVMAWDVSKGTLLWKREGSGNGHSLEQSSSTGRFAVLESRASNSDTTHHVVDGTSGASLWSSSSSWRDDVDVTFSLDGRLAMVGPARYAWSPRGGYDIREALSGRGLWSLPDRYADFTPGRDTVVSRASNGDVRLHEAVSGRAVWRYAGDQTEFKLSSDGRFVAVSDRSGTLRFLDLASGREVARVTFFRDGSWFLLDPVNETYDASASRRLTHARPLPGLLARLLRPRTVAGAFVK